MKIVIAIFIIIALLKYFEECIIRLYKEKMNNNNLDIESIHHLIKFYKFLLKERKNSFTDRD